MANDDARGQRLLAAIMKFDDEATEEDYHDEYVQ
jgi:hypothetical protein